MNNIAMIISSLSCNFPSTNIRLQTSGIPFGPFAKTDLIVLNSEGSDVIDPSTH